MRRRARESYLDGEKILAAAAATRAAAIHPGYGFLSENAAFAEAVQAAGLLWVGAPPAAIRAMGLKDAAKRLMMQAGVPVTPGYLGEDQSPARLKREAEAIGYPILIKAVAGGGGKGMRRVAGCRSFSTRRSTPAGARPRRLSARIGCCSRNTSHRRGTWRCRSSLIPTASSCICSNAIARCNAATRR